MSIHRFAPALFAAILVGCPMLTSVARATSEPAALHSARSTEVDGCRNPPVDPTAEPKIPEFRLPRAGGGIERVVCRFHVVRRADGTGGVDERVIAKMMEDLNVGFRDTPYRFVREPGTTYVDNDVFYADLPDFQTQIDLVNCCFEAGVLNWFLVPLVGGGTAPGGTWIGPPFTTGQRAIIMAYDNTGTPRNIVTPTHEMGHIGNLIHPYETAFGVECVTRVFCTSVGDLLCDTPASPGLSSQNVTATGFFYAGTPGPCSGDPPYDPNPRLYMDTSSQPGHVRRDEFSPQQIQRHIDFMETQQADLLGPLRPSVFVDCDSNGVDDLDEILAGTTPDGNLDMVPDVCQTFPNPGDLIVSGMHQNVRRRPRYYAAGTGDWRGDLWNGQPWVHQVRLGPDGHVYLTSQTVVQRMDLATGRTIDNVADGRLEAVGVFVDLLFDGNGDLLLLDNNASDIRRYAASDGSFLGTFSNLGAMTLPKYMEYGPDGHIYVVGVGSLGNTVQKFDAVSGAALGAFVDPGDGGLSAGQGLVFHGGHLYVSNVPANNVLRFDAVTGDFVDEFVAAGAGGLNNPHSLRFGPDGDLYVASRNTHSVKRYDGETGAALGDFVTPGSGGGGHFGGLESPAGLLFVPGGEAVSVPDPERSAAFVLGRPAPDPSRGRTTFTFQIQRAATVQVAVYNVLGQRVRGLGEGFRDAGEHLVVWDGRTTTGEGVSSGVYFLRVTVDGSSRTRAVRIRR